MNILYYSHVYAWSSLVELLKPLVGYLLSDIRCAGSVPGLCVLQMRLLELPVGHNCYFYGVFERITAERIWFFGEGITKVYAEVS